ncbi:DUF3086 domain-containing protein [Phormidium pseudopriestleyi FRX01]|uniref:DUF3086 domain-containing protein n=1 Tax=Phormidium pseudopriestleyi FRX01 TaxID=1759528 RepID=A0ABS3FT71_9CYAN|nr:DUF3086 domain-containing protein [Phormidium pseudopriestleyi]MBO0350300.1 DUF3086 domain-containing protein [Phormidium pseudopriestleyi FRX01]
MNADETHNPEPLETQDKSDSPEPFEASSSESVSADSTQGINLSEDLWKEAEPAFPDETASPLPELTLVEAESQNWEPSAELPVEPAEQPGEEQPPEELPTEELPTEEMATPPLAIEDEAASLGRRVAQLQEQERELKAAIVQLQGNRAELWQEQTETQAAIGRLVQDALTELEQRKHNLQISVEQLERRQERIRTEMRTTFAGVSQDLAIRVQGFKDYLSGSLQDLVTSVEQLELAPPEPEPAKMPPKSAKGGDRTGAPTPTFAEQPFQDRAKQIRRLLDKYRTMPDYYGPPWQVRRTFEPVHAERLSNWFFTQGARGAVRSLGSRLQNILVASAAISVLKSLYGDRLRTLVLANSPERLGEWRRGLQDSLGISRIDFGPEGGVVLFEVPEALAQKADRLLKQKQVPLILIDETENQINLSLLQFPLWLAFAADPELPTL